MKKGNHNYKIGWEKKSKVEKMKHHIEKLGDGAIALCIYGFIHKVKNLSELSEDEFHNFTNEFITDLNVGEGKAKIWMDSGKKTIIVEYV
tara:strand:+ start:484 stop:753 length:270 start_codon:yes stop_codon:yes gene_type:complete